LNTSRSEASSGARQPTPRGRSAQGSTPSSIQPGEQASAARQSGGNRFGSLSSDEDEDAGERSCTAMTVPMSFLEAEARGRNQRAAVAKTSTAAPHKSPISTLTSVQALALISKLQ
jgi:hypothetical protein